MLFKVCLNILVTSFLPFQFHRPFTSYEVKNSNFIPTNTQTQMRRQHYVSSYCHINIPLEQYPIMPDQ